MPTPGMPSPVKALGQARPSGASMAPQARCCSPAALQRRLPILAWLPDYSMSWLKMDAIAGLSVGLTVIPQALAYAEVAALPPQVRRLPPAAAPLQPQHRPGGRAEMRSVPSRQARHQNPNPVGPPGRLGVQSAACDRLGADTRPCNRSCHTRHTQALDQ